MNTIGIILQARTGSSRLPNKVLIPFYENKSILELLLEKIKASLNIPIIVATSERKEDNTIVKLAESINVNFFRGDENNVLNRFIKAAEYYKIQSIIRICPDNPFLDIEFIKQLTKFVDDADYTCYVINDMPSIKTHYGFWGERVKLSALKSITRMTNDVLFLEHVTNYIYTNPGKFSIKKIDVSNLVGNRPIRLTLDTKEDFVLLQKLYSELATNYPDNYSVSDIVQYLDENENYYSQMKQNIMKNAK